MQTSRFARFAALAAIVACFASPLMAQDADAKKKRRGRAAAARGAGQMSFFSAEIRRAVPGIASLVKISPDQRKKVAEARQAALKDEAVQKAMKAAKDKGTDRKARREAQAVIREAQNKSRSALMAVLTEEQRALVSKVNAAAEAATKGVRAEYKDKLKEVKGDRAARQKLTKELNAKLGAAVKAKVQAVLSDEQKASIAAMAKKRGAAKKDGAKKAGAKKGKKKDKDADGEPKAKKKRDKKGNKGEGKGKKKDKDA